MLNRFIPGEDEAPFDNDNPQGWNYSQDIYGYNLGNQFMNDLRTKFYWDQDTKSWKALPGTSGNSAGVGVPKIGTSTKGVATKGVASSTTSVGTPGASVGSSVGAKGMAVQAGIGAAGQLGGSYLSGKGAKEAARIQAQSAREALQFAREQEGAAQGRYGQSKEQYDKQVADWYAARNALLSRYGVDINLGAGGIPPGGFPPQPNVFAPQGDGARNVAPPGGGPSPVRHPRPSGPPQGSTLGDIAVADADWNDWSRYNLGGRNA